MTRLTDDEIRAAVVDRYGAAARAVSPTRGCGCGGSVAEAAGCGCGGSVAEAAGCGCGGSVAEAAGCGCGEFVDDSLLIGRSQYPSGGEAGAVPAAALAASLGCGNPTALAGLRPGEVVLDLGSGGGLDVLLSARRVGPTGMAYGLDLTPDMLALARRNQAEAGLENVEFLAGSIESVPLPDDSVDVIISNCVVNLSTDKPAVIREAFRVLRPGGRLAISDIVLSRPLPEPFADTAAVWTGCIAGALVREDLLRMLAEHGFVDADVEAVHVWPVPEPPELDGAITSSFVRARKPSAGK